MRPVLRKPALNVDSIRKWALDHYRRTLLWPGRSSGRVLHPEGEGEFWSKIYFCGRKRRRGLPGPLTQIYAKLQATEDLRQTGIRRFLRAFCGREGRLPKLDGTDNISGFPSWAALEARLQKSTCTAKTLRQIANEEGLIYRRGYTKNQVIEWVHGFRKNLGKWPTRKSGTIEQDLNRRSWAGIDKALQLKQCGFGVSTTLCKLCQETC